MDKLERFICCLETEQDEKRKSAIINNMYYHVFTNDLVKYIGKQNIAKQLKAFERQGEDVLFWKAMLVDIKIVPENIRTLKNVIKDLNFTIKNCNQERSVYKAIWEKFCLMASYPQLFLCFPETFKRNDFINDLIVLGDQIFIQTGNEVFDLVDIIQADSVEEDGWKTVKEIEPPSLGDLWKEYCENKNPENFLTLFSGDFSEPDYYHLFLLCHEIERYLPNRYLMAMYGYQLIELHKRICKIRFPNPDGEIYDKWFSYLNTSKQSFGKLFDMFFSNFDNMYPMWHSYDEDVEEILDMLDSSNHKSPIVTIFEEYVCGSIPSPNTVESSDSTTLCSTDEYETTTESSDSSDSSLDSYSDEYSEYESEGELPCYEQIVHDFDFVKLLIEDDFPIDRKDEFGETLLMNAVRWRQDNAVIYLCDKGANLNSQNRSGKTVLHMTCGKLHKDNWSYVPFLLVHGANPNIRSYARKTPMMYAIQNHATSTIKALKDNCGFPWFYHRRLVNKLPLYLQKILVA